MKSAVEEYFIRKIYDLEDDNRHLKDKIEDYETLLDHLEWPENYEMWRVYKMRYDLNNILRKAEYFHQRFGDAQEER